MNKLQTFINRVERFIAKKSKPKKRKNYYYYSNYVSDNVITKEFKLKLIGSGVSRRVFSHKDFPDVVFKIQGRGDKTCSPNYSEWSAYRKAKPKEQEILAKPISISKNYRVLAMERADQILVRFTKVRPFIKKIHKVLPAHLRWDVQGDYKPYGATSKNYELTPHNVGVMPNGKFKVFDYASSVTTC